MSNSELMEQALSILIALGMPEQQHNNRTAVCLLALLDLHDDKTWDKSENPTLGIRGILDFARQKFKISYAENTRETIRDESIKPMVAAGILVKNPDDPYRAVNSPATVYKVEPDALNLFRTYGGLKWSNALTDYLQKQPTLVELYARAKVAQRLNIGVGEKEITLSPGDHSGLIKKILEEFRPRFTPNSAVLYVGDTGTKWSVFERDELAKLGIEVTKHGQMPDVLLFDSVKNWLFLIESVTSNGPIDGRRYEELVGLFAAGKAELVFITAFPDRKIMRKYLSVLAWETEVWIAEAPDHLIHFNGDKFLGPHQRN